VRVTQSLEKAEHETTSGQRHATCELRDAHNEHPMRAHRPQVTMTPFPDHYSSVAAHYARYRPHYPHALFAWLASVAPNRRLAWDCGTGNGQAATAMAAHFAHVVATDPSTAQLANAERGVAVSYAAMTAEQAALTGASVAVITVAQALHWFDRPAFYAEVKRVLTPRGVLAAWSYGLCTLGDAALDAELRRFHDETVGPYWPPGRALVDAGYEGLDLPFDELSPPPLAMEARWTLEEFAGYLSTWSAVQRARASTGMDPLPALVEALRARWGAEKSGRRIEWPLAVRAGRV
jgi:SAM-dependent methyltransferase